MGRKKPEWQISEDMRIVFECSPNLMPCKKFLHANIYRFADHMKKDKCRQCIAWFQQTDKELSLPAKGNRYSRRGDGKAAVRPQVLPLPNMRSMQ
jgi:hypothetical protein